LPKFIGQLLDFHLSILTNDHARRDGITEEDQEWIFHHFGKFDALAAQDDSFRFALEAAIDWRYLGKPRAAIARIWSGIEALFGIESELVYRISLLAASLLEPRGQTRKARFRSVRRLYGIRSKAVHGQPLTEEQLRLAVSESFDILRSLMVSIIDKGRMLTIDDLDDAVMG
jgi:hypothetical protein